MIRLINKDNARVGMVVNVRYLNGKCLHSNKNISAITDDFFELDALTGPYYFRNFYFELVSMPERRRLTWEYAKSVFPNWPFRIWIKNHKDGEDAPLYFNCGNPDTFKANFDDNLIGWHNCNDIYIDPPHPEIPEVPEPWLNESYESIGKLKKIKEPIMATFSEALEFLKDGKKVSRAGWNGKGMFLFLVKGSRFTVNRAPLLGIYPEGTEIQYRPHIDMKTVDGEVVPWVASQSDLLSNDWSIVDS